MEVEESLNIELECSLCVRVFNEPITLGCGHTFCRHCLLQAMQHNNQCPLCRQSYFIDPRTHPVSITIRNIVEKTHPQELNARKQEATQISEETQTWDYLLPIFPLDAVVFPGSEFPMLIFEHRYQKMLKSILQGHRMFGLVAITPDEGNPSGFSPSSIGCSLMVTDCTTKMDGQFVIKVKGIQRFKIVDHWIKDQYIMARVEMIEEVYPEAEELSVIAALADKINTVITSYNQFPSAKSSIICQLLSKNLRKLKRSIPQLGTENTAEQLTAFTYWLCQNLPASLSSKQFLLEEMSLMNRLLGLLEMMRTIYPFECFRSTDEFLMQLQMHNQEQLQLMLEREQQLQQQQQSAMEEFCASVQKSSDSPSPLLHSHSHSSASTSVSEMSIASLIN